jgi:hypothetical protein
MESTFPLLFAIVLLFLALGVAKRYLASTGLPTNWVSVPRILRAGYRASVTTVAGLWRAGRGTIRFAQRRRRFRRRPSRATVATLR